MIRKVDPKDVTSVDDLHKALKGDGVKKAQAKPEYPAHPTESGKEKIKEVYILDAEFETPGERHAENYTTPGMHERPKAEPTPQLTPATKQEWQGDEAVHLEHYGDEQFTSRNDADPILEGGPEAKAGDYRVAERQYNDETMHHGTHTYTHKSEDGTLKSLNDQDWGLFAKAGERGGHIVGYDKHGKPRYSEGRGRKAAEESKEKLIQAALKQRKEAKKKQVRAKQGVLQGTQGGTLVGHGPGGKPIYERSKEKAMKGDDLNKAYGAKGPVADFPLGGQEKRARAKMDAKEGLSSPATKKPRLTMGHLKKLATAQGFKTKESGGKTSFSRSFYEELGGVPTLMKSLAVLAASSGTIQVAEDQAWDSGMEDENYQNLRTLLRSFPPRMWQYLKRAADQSIEPRVAIRHIADCIGEISKGLLENDLAKGEEAITPTPVSDSLIDTLEKSMAQSWLDAEEVLTADMKKACPTHAFTLSGWAHGTNYNAICRCSQVTKGQIAYEAEKRLVAKSEHDKVLKEAIDILGVDRDQIRKCSSK